MDKLRAEYGQNEYKKGQHIDSSIQNICKKLAKILNFLIHERQQTTKSGQYDDKVEYKHRKLKNECKKKVKFQQFLGRIYAEYRHIIFETWNMKKYGDSLKI